MFLVGSRALRWLAMFCVATLFSGSAVAGWAFDDSKSIAKDAPSITKTLRVAQSGTSSPASGDPRLNNPPPREQTRSEGDVLSRTDGVTAYVTYKTPYEFYLTILTVVLGIAFLALYCFVHRGNALDQSFSRYFIILTVIFSALLLIVAGYSEKQTAPVFGLLGTIVGYLFGVSAGSKPESGPDKQQPPTSTTK
jgi:hypothetical protein